MFILHHLHTHLHDSFAFFKITYMCLSFFNLYASLLFFSPNTLWFPIWSYFRFTGCTLNISFYTVGWSSKAGKLDRLKFLYFFTLYMWDVHVALCSFCFSLSEGILSFLLFRADWLKTPPVRMSDKHYALSVELAYLSLISSFPLI